MTQTWSETARTALACKRAWSDVLRQSGLAPGAVALSAVDVAVLSLIVDELDPVDLVCPDRQLRGLLADLFARDPGRRTITCREAPAGASRFVLLVDVRALGAPHAGTGGGVACLAYGLTRIAPLPTAVAGRSAFLRILATVSPALWPCGLALVLADQDDPLDGRLVAALSAVMRGDWIDPLRLFEKVQDLTGRLKAMGEVDDHDPAAEAGRVAVLQREIETLKASALVQQHLRMIEASERAKERS